MDRLGCPAFHSSCVMRHSQSGFTLIEMILIMALLVIGISIVAPHMGEFFKGRTLKSEANQIISLTRMAQSRAVSGGVPIVLWFDTSAQKYGIEEEPGYNEKDPDAVEFKLDENLKLEIADSDITSVTPGASDADPARAGLPQIIFLPDGTLGENSPQTIKIKGQNDTSVSVTQTRDGMQYEIATTTTHQ